MNEQDALFAAILDAPDDNAPRLVYADWLDEHDQPERAEFIRVQVELARLPEGDPRKEALGAREQGLMKAHGREWRKELPAWARWHCTYERGFAAEARTTAREFLKGAAGLFRRAPIRSLQLENLDGPLAAAVAASPHLEKVSVFVVRDTALTGAGWRTLLAAPGLAQVTDLRLSGGALGPAEVHVFASAPLPARLRSLTLNGCPLGDLGAGELAASPRLAGLTTLRLLNAGVGEEGARTLAASQTLANLTRLELDYNWIGDDGVKALAASPHLGKLAHLGLRHCGMSEEGVRALAESPRLTSLRTVAPGYGAGSETGKRFREILGPRYVSF
jgi:uncharacterized protein (TIGR02996 family)